MSGSNDRIGYRQNPPCPYRSRHREVDPVPVLNPRWHAHQTPGNKYGPGVADPVGDCFSRSSDPTLQIHFRWIGSVWTFTGILWPRSQNDWSRVPQNIGSVAKNHGPDRCKKIPLEMIVRRNRDSRHGFQGFVNGKEKSLSLFRHFTSPFGPENGKETHSNDYVYHASSHIDNPLYQSVITYGWAQIY
jgi:hypothetical protein